MNTAILLGAARIISKPINDIYEAGKSHFKFQLAKFKTNENINKVYKKVSSIHKVKTIWQIDKEISLKTFYYPPRLIIDGRPINVNTLKKIPDEGNAVVQGIVGQGKSIFMRYLCYQEAKIGTRLPIFFELRRIAAQDTLEGHIIGILKSYGLECDEILLDFLYSTGKVVLLLDGFDELPTQIVSKVINDLELLSDRYPALKIVVSSRPDSGIERSPKFRVYKLAPLDASDHPKILEKLMEDKSRAEDMVKIINSSGTKIRTLLTTPLMVTLLVLVYKAEQKVPTQLSEFYDNLFPMLLYRHDKSKPGYVRERRTKLNERVLQQTFEAFCFLSRKSDLSTLSSRDMHRLSDEAFKAMQISCDSSDFISDITKVSNLMVEEGYKYHFIHKSVQEFHAASFLNSRPEKIISKFYKQMMTHGWYKWPQELRFLSQIDRYRFCKLYSIPAYTRFFKRYHLDPSSLSERSSRSLDAMLSAYKVHLVAVQGNESSFAPLGFMDCFGEVSHISEISIINSLTDMHYLVNDRGLDYENGNFDRFIIKGANSREVTISLFPVLMEMGVLKDAYRILHQQLDIFVSDFQEMVDFVAREDQTEELITMDIS